MNYEIRETGVYLTRGYLTKDRWMSYWYQITEAMNLSPLTVLEIGPGNRIVTDIIKKIGIEVTTLDIDPANDPDIVADVTALRAGEIGQFDLVMACQILEHIRYEDAIKALVNIHSISRKHLILSVPYTERGTFKIFLGFMLFPLLRRKSFAKIFTIFPRAWTYNGIHYWELGAKGFSLRRFLKDLKAAKWSVLRRYAVKENPYHYFFICEKID